MLILGEVVGVHIDEAFIRDGRFDITAAKPLARCGYQDYAVVESRVLARPAEGRRGWVSQAGPARRRRPLSGGGDSRHDRVRDASAAAEFGPLATRLRELKSGFALQSCGGFDLTLPVSLLIRIVEPPM